MSAEVIRLKPARPCPICGKQSVQQFHPFCSARCQDVDLHRWLSGGYRIPTDEAPKQAPVPDEDED